MKRIFCHMYFHLSSSTRALCSRVYIFLTRLQKLFCHNERRKDGKISNIYVRFICWKLIINNWSSIQRSALSYQFFKVYNGGFKPPLYTPEKLIADCYFKRETYWESEFRRYGLEGDMRKSNPQTVNSTLMVVVFLYTSHIPPLPGLIFTHNEKDKK